MTLEKTAATTTLFFECFEGKDLHFKIPPELSQTVTLNYDRVVNIGPC